MHVYLLQEETIESHLGKTLGKITYRDVWTDTAELLIRQVQQTLFNMSQSYLQILIEFSNHDLQLNWLKEIVFLSQSAKMENCII